MVRQTDKDGVGFLPGASSRLAPTPNQSRNEASSRTKQVLALSSLTSLQTFALIHLVAPAAFSLLIRVFRAFSLLDSSYNLQLFHNQVSILCPAPPR